MIDQVAAHARAAEADPQVVAICVTGAGRGFCAGLDAEYLRQVTEQGLAERDPDELPVLFGPLLRISKPIIAAVNGPAAGGGFVLALLSDLRFMAEEAKLTPVFSKRGLMAEHGLSWLLPRIVGLSRALDLLWSSRLVAAEEALRIGLADRTCPAERLLHEVEAYVADLAANASPRSIAHMKRQVYEDLDRPLAEAAWATDALVRATVDHEDTREGVLSLIERRAPRFAGWSGFPGAAR